MRHLTFFQVSLCARLSMPSVCCRLKADDAITDQTAARRPVYSHSLPDHTEIFRRGKQQLFLLFLSRQIKDCVEMKYLIFYLSMETVTETGLDTVPSLFLF